MTKNNKNKKKYIKLKIKKKIKKQQKYKIVCTMTKKQKNKKMHSCNGNIKNHNIKIMSWNKGSSWAENKIDYITHLLATEKPAILAIQEL